MLLKILQYSQENTCVGASLVKLQASGKGDTPTKEPFFAKFIRTAFFKELLWRLLLNPFPANVPIVYTLKTSENESISGDFGGGGVKWVKYPKNVGGRILFYQY